MKQLFADKFDTRIVCFDFDGTITQDDKFPEIGVANPNIVDLIRRLKKKRYYIIINSARDTIYYEDIKKYLEANGIEYDQLALKTKPTADLYIDDKSLFLDNPYLFETLIDFYFTKNLYDIVHGITSGSYDNEFEKNIANVPENPKYIEPNEKNFQVVLTMTGGMDSTTMWQMLEESGTDYEMFYVDMGQEYAKIEIETIKKLTGRKPIVIDAKMDFKTYKHILLGRNPAIILILAEYMKNHGKWGEIWFGNLQGESPVAGGDKSRRFMNDMQHILTLLNYDARIVNPLIGMDKPDEVAFWKDRDMELFKQTKSCFDPDVLQCGKCQTCFRKYVAFKVNNIDISKQFETMEFSPFVEKYERVMNEALEKHDFSHYSPARIQTTLEVIKILK